MFYAYLFSFGLVIAGQATESQGNGTPSAIRTRDLCLRRAALYPAELWVQLLRFERGEYYSLSIILSSEVQY